MLNGRTHLVIGTAICAALMLLFIAFSNRLPENIPIQITIDGSPRNSLPKSLFVYGIPVVFMIVNLINKLPRSKKASVPVYRYYIIPGIAIVLSVLALVFALSI
jgi:hypothetical protein